MRSSVAWNLSKVIVLLVVLASFAYAVTHTTAPVAPTQEDRLISSMPPSSNFVQSGGLVADTDPSVPDASDALTHAAAAVPASEQASTF